MAHAVLYSQDSCLVYSVCLCMFLCVCAFKEHFWIWIKVEYITR